MGSFLPRLPSMHGLLAYYIASGSFPLLDSWVSTIHVDGVGPPLPFTGYRYLLTVIDRFIRRPEVIPIDDLTVTTVASTTNSSPCSLTV